MSKAHAALITILAITICTLTGCTSQVWREKPTYTELITGFYLAAEEDLLVGVGTEHSYVFEIESDLKQALMLDRSIYSDLAFSPFNLDKKNNVTGNLFLHAHSAKLDDSQLALINNLNFKKYRELPPVGMRRWERGDYRLVAKLKGRRYTTKAGSEIEIFEKPLAVAIRRPDSPTEVAEKIMITPGAILFDAGAVIIMLPIALAFTLAGGAA